MEKQILGGLLVLLSIVELIVYYAAKKYNIQKIMAYKLSLFLSFVYNVNLIIMLLSSDSFFGVLTKQMVPIFTLLFFRNFYVEFKNNTNKKSKYSFEYFFVHLFPVIFIFTVLIDLLRTYLNTSIQLPSIDVFHFLVIVLIVCYQLFILARVLYFNIRFYKASLERYRQVYMGHILVNIIYIIATLTVFFTNHIQENLLMSGILFSLYTAFLMVNYIKKEWLPHSTVKPIEYKEVLKKITGQSTKASDRRTLDHLTGLFSRTYFLDYLESLDVNDDSLAVILMDVSGLKLINENFGYHVGDELLLEMSVALSEAFVTGTIARISGRVFAVLISQENEELIADKIRMIKSMAEDRHSLNVQLNFGYYIRGKENITATEMHERAHEVLFYNRMLVNQKHQRQLAYMLFDNFKNYMPVLTEHLKDVSQKCLLFGRYLGLKSQAVESLELAGLIHDIALTNLPLVVEHEMIHSHDFQRKAYNNHVKKGYEIAIETGLNEAIASIILQHHEMYDGSGFPNHLKGDEINSFAQILSIVDFVDVYLKHNRKEGLEDALKSKINVAFSKELVYNMIAFLKIESNKGDHNGFNQNW